MSISKHFRYRNNSFQSDIFVSDIGIADLDVGCQISLTLRSMSMPTYVKTLAHNMVRSLHVFHIKPPVTGHFVPDVMRLDLLPLDLW
jgi:hypothetical protein